MSPSHDSFSASLPEHVDILIIGGGTAGLVLASRFSENSDCHVLVLEAGADVSDDPAVLTPGLAATLQGDSKYDWDFRTLPQAALGGRSIEHTRGKGLGGSSLIHRNMMTFPSKSSIDCWASLGNPSWTFESMEPYYRKFHTFHEPSPQLVNDLGLNYLDEALHGKSGPVQVTFGNYQSDFDLAWTSSFENLGRKALEDPISGLCIGGHNTGSSIDPSTMTRSYAGNAYVNKEVRQRPNLHIVTGALVEKMSIRQNEGDDKAHVTGVIFHDQDGASHSASATEFILCAGVIQSPQILELSGIGARDLLTSLGIDCVVDLPQVGENLQDHVTVGVSFESNIQTFDSFRDPAVAQAAFAEYQKDKTGPMTLATYSAAFLPCMGFLGQEGEKDLEQLLEQHLGDIKIQDSPLKEQYKLLRALIKDPQQSSAHYLLFPIQLSPGQSPAPVPDEAQAADYITLFTMLSHPFSRGSVHITSTNPASHPATDPKYFSHPLDVELLSRHLQYLETIAAAESLSSLLKKDGRRIPVDVDLGNLESAKKLTELGFTTYHPCGTCAMMPRDLGGVVGQDLRVHGVGNLRVVDASVFPMIPRGNIQSSVYAVAERAADMIKAEWTQST